MSENIIKAPVKSLIRSEIGKHYVQGLKKAKLMSISIVGLVAIASAGVVGVTLLIGGLIYYLSRDTSNLLYVLVVPGLFILGISGLAISLLMSEKFWVKVLKVDDLVGRITGHYHA